MLILLTADIFWKLFVNTGSVAAYLIYKRLVVQ
ncbi:MAG: YqzL family protein [Candidatus Syntrophonatronum acetioxidans]|uniref:YqzL family protein n=1 Tax=Candidatus Syntrophonatronum acetioxidans TaxID=1795816 RepID=A0A424YGV1_9FIRM|nr:MAG: YqzL family protein [Candidatus Syntrophonatronum acetioxidans]